MNYILSIKKSCTKKSNFYTINYRTTSIGLVIFSAIGLLDYLLSDYWLGKIIGLSVVGLRNITIGLSIMGTISNAHAALSISIDFLRNSSFSVWLNNTFARRNFYPLIESLNHGNPWWRLLIYNGTYL